MVAEIVGNVSSIILAQDLFNQASHLITLFEAIGGLIVAYIAFNIISLFLDRKKSKELARMRELLEQINRKLDKRR